MTDRSHTTYGERTITSQPNIDSTKRSRREVSLTPAEARVLALLPTYRTLAAIGTELGIGRRTVEKHVENIYRKLGATTRAEAVKLAESAGLLPPSVTIGGG
jgi:DNA-binding CsgD family transcriptional regulator